MAEIARYPASLPGPSVATIVSAERRMLSPTDGPFEGRTVQRDRIARQQLEFTFVAGEAQTFRTWWSDQLDRGGRTFASTWPLPEGFVEAVRRFIGTPKWQRLSGILWRVSGECEVHGRGELPLAGSNPSLVAAFDFDTGLIDLAKPARTILANGAFAPSAAQAVNGTMSGGFGTSDYFWLPASADFGFGTGDFGIELWYYFPDPPGAQSVDLWALNGVFNLYDNGAPQFQNQPLSAAIDGFSGTVTAPNTWIHMFVGRAGGATYCAKNGVMSDATPFGPNATTAYDVGSTGYLVFGNRNPSSSQLFSGEWFADRIRVYKGECPWTADFTPLTAPYPA